MPQDNYTPIRAQCTFDTGNYQGNIASRAFLEVLGYSESTFGPLSEDEKLGGVDASGNTLLPLGAVNLTWYAPKSTRIFRDVRFLVSPHPHYDLIIGAPFIEKHSLLGPPNLTIARRKPESSAERPSSTLPTQPVANSLPLSDLEESDQGNISTPCSLNDDNADVPAAGNNSPVNSVSPTCPPGLDDELKLHVVSDLVATSEPSFPCEDDVPMTDSGSNETILPETKLKREPSQKRVLNIQSQTSSSSDSSSYTPVVIPILHDASSRNSSDAKDYAAPPLKDEFESSEQSIAITAAVKDITKSLGSFATSYLISKFETQFTQCAGNSQCTSSGTSTKGNVDGKEKGKQRANGKRRRTSKNGDYENGDDEEKERDDDDSRQGEDKDARIRPLSGGWGCIFHIQYPDYYHPQNMCLSPKTQQRYNLCATKSFRRLDELVYVFQAFPMFMKNHVLPSLLCCPIFFHLLFLWMKIDRQTGTTS